ncbi:hypothetical protein [Citromicrobium sp. WPS32]|uniref:hypothetical protein n=1 Tax=Citromicrobium sp. WPS32 TaxID=1634517 RepID=UPI0006C92439|nr:hypothetical protein [Citromicrobium sp. WPS32]KPM17707.1 hypothetical protein WG75_00055 [Citromicrobium sp. WPS32]
MAHAKLKSLLGAAAGVALIATPVASGQAQDARVQTVAADQVRLPMRDARGVQLRGVQMAAAMDSRDAQIVVFYGDSPAALEAAKQGAREAIAAGLPVRGMMVADPLEPQIVGGSQISGRNQIEFYANGTSTAIIDNVDRAPQRVAGMVRAELERGYNVVIRPQRASLDGDSPTLASR